MAEPCEQGLSRTSLARQDAGANLVIRCDESDQGWVRELIDEYLADGDAAVASKDAHLVASASAVADDRLLSGDGKAREKFTRLAAHDQALGRVHWVDPGWDEVPDWLLERAPDKFE